MWRPDIEGWRRIWIIALREIRERGGSRSYRISTVVGALLVAALVLLPTLVSPSKTYRVGLAGDSPDAVVAALEAQARPTGHRLEVTRYATVAQGEEAVRDKKVDVLLVDLSRLEWRQRADSALAATVANAVQAMRVEQQATRLGITSEQLAQLLVPVTLTGRTLGTAGTADAETVALLAVGALFVAISFYAGFVLTGVVQEKSSRIAEVLLARMPAREILAGKVLGIGAVGLAQFALLGLTAGVTARLADQADAPDIAVWALLDTVLWFVLGYLFYSVAQATLGATASRVEDAQAAVAPVTVVMLLSYLGVIFAEENPDSLLTLLLSYFPPTAPIVMTYRSAVGAAPAWQVVTSAAWMVLVIWGLVRVGGRIYSGALLRFGPRVPLRQMIGRGSV